MNSVFSLHSYLHHKNSFSLSLDKSCSIFRINPACSKVHLGAMRKCPAGFPVHILTVNFDTAGVSVFQYGWVHIHSYITRWHMLSTHTADLKPQQSRVMRQVLVVKENALIKSVNSSFTLNYSITGNHKMYSIKLATNQLFWFTLVSMRLTVLAQFVVRMCHKPLMNDNTLKTKKQIIQSGPGSLCYTKGSQRNFIPKLDGVKGCQRITTTREPVCSCSTTAPDQQNQWIKTTNRNINNGAAKQNGRFQRRWWKVWFNRSNYPRPVQRAFLGLPKLVKPHNNLGQSGSSLTLDKDNCSKLTKKHICND